MQARLSLVRFPSLIVAIFFALAAAIVLGGVLGYTLKPAVEIPGPTHVVVVHGEGSVSPDDTQCVWINKQKSC